MRVLLADCNTTDLANWTPTGDAKLYSDLANRVEGDASITLTKEDVLHNYFGMRKYVSTFSLRGNSIHFFVRVNKSLITERKVTGLEFIVYDSDENSIRWVHSLTYPIEIWDVYSCHYYAYLNYPYYPTAYPPNVIRDYAFNPDDCVSIEVRFYTPDPSVMILDKYMVNVDYITLDSVGSWEGVLKTDVTLPEPQLLGKAEGVSVAANTDVFEEDLVAPTRGFFIVQVMVSSAAYPIVKKNGILAGLNESSDLTPNSWYEFWLAAEQGENFNIRFSADTTINLKIYFIKSL